MSCTPEQRAAISRANGQKSRGPTTDDGRARSRMNATKHGLRARTACLPNAEPEVIARRKKGTEGINANSLRPLFRRVPPFSPSGGARVG
jgi:hypothetical protein